MKKIVIVMFILLSSCSNEKNITASCVVENEDLKVEETIIAKGKKVKNEIVKITVTKEEVPQVEEAIKVYTSIKGVSVEKKDVGDKVEVNINVDYTKIDLQDAITNGLISATKDKNIKYVDFTMTKENLEKQGFTCKIVE